MLSYRAAIGLGSNLGDRSRNIDAALALLDGQPLISVLLRSELIETEPVRVSDRDPGGPYINAAAIVQTGLSPRELLGTLQRVERALGRDRTRQAHGAARVIDLDLLLYSDQTVSERGLTVPHPQLHRRSFVLGPLVQIAPGWPIPGLGVTVRAAQERCVTHDRA
ncbi:MAG: 2-amino-4-hydroxy-6-hydroxymethyldihydropteridine diphosphokinase [Isosphaera sp.]|nr:2-amino-4-hydroxy-6-hydroxymethyldihydropteridine diphosphokinase [Isosphaera sp.]